MRDDAMVLVQHCTLQETQSPASSLPRCGSERCKRGPLRKLVLMDCIKEATCGANVGCGEPPVVPNDNRDENLDHAKNSLTLPRMNARFSEEMGIDSCEEGPTLLTNASLTDAAACQPPIGTSHTSSLLKGPSRAALCTSISASHPGIGLPNNPPKPSSSRQSGASLSGSFSTTNSSSTFWNDSVLLPYSGLLQFQNKVAGRHMMLLSPDGHLCKDASRSQAELDFYMKLRQDPQNPLHEFLAEYYGQFYMSTRDLQRQCPGILGMAPDSDPDRLLHFMALQDMTHGMVRPCLADIKMGRQQFAPGAHNQESKTLKSNQTISSSLGFRLCGTKVYHSEAADYVVQDKYDCRRHTKWQIQEQFQSFFSSPRGLRQDVLRSILGKLHRLQRHIERQTEWLFYTSSLVMMYDGDQAQDPRPNVVLVDFAHTIPSDGQLDHNFLEGLRNLIDVLQCIATDSKYCPPPDL
eukprot:GGOE01000876.1.p1 GENE.GGOE01000876.1~~GGOE01000876.1.p1  ORF type:complete len:465 (-),score=58.69 GGOE01000876.1:300-1694(-)